MAAYVDGARVVDLWGGTARSGRPWAESTLCVSMSTAKIVVALVMAMLVERCSLDVEAPIASYWPEFGTHGKADIALADVLTHRAGLPWIPDYASVGSLDDAALFERGEQLLTLAAEGPPATSRGEFVYHVITMGLLCGEVCRRVGGQPIERFVREQIAAPLGIELHFGLPAEAVDRAADLSAEAIFSSSGMGAVTARCLMLGERTLGEVVAEQWNTATYRRSVNPSLAAQTDARSLARLCAALADGGGSLVPENLLRRHTEVRVSGRDGCWHAEWRVGLGFARGTPGGFHFGPGPRSFGHHGVGGAIAFADPDRRVGFAYLPSHFRFATGTDPRAERLIDAVYAAAAGHAPGR